MRLATNPKSFSTKFHDPEPPGEVDRAFSFPHAVAMLALGIEPGPEWLADATAELPAVRTLRRRVEVVLHPSADQIGDWVVEHQYRELPATATVTARGGTFAADAVFGRGAPWSADTRLSDAELIEKARQIAADPGTSGTAVPWGDMLRLAETTDLRPLLATLRARRSLS